MNAARRKLIAAINQELAGLMTRIDEIRADEQDIIDGMSEKAQEGPRGEALQAIVEALTNASTSIEDVSSFLEEVIGA